MKKVTNKCVYCRYKYSCVYPFTNMAKGCAEPFRFPVLMAIRGSWLKELGLKAKSLRVKAKIRIPDMANMTGYSVGTIARFENGENNNLLLYLLYNEICEKGGVINDEETENATTLKFTDNGR